MVIRHQLQNSWRWSALCFVVMVFVLWQGFAEAQDSEGKLGEKLLVNFCGLFDDNDALEAVIGVGLNDLLDLNGSITVNPSELIFNFTGNGVPDAANELGLLQAILNDPAFDNGIVTHQEIKDVWDHNYKTLTKNNIGSLQTRPPQLQTIALEIAAPGLIDILVAYITLGDGDFVKEDGVITATGSFGFVATLLDQFDVVLDAVRQFLPAESQDLAQLHNPVLNKEEFAFLDMFRVEGDADADADGLTNREEFEIFALALCADAGAAEGTGEIDYVAAALNPDADGDGMPDGYEFNFLVSGVQIFDLKVPDGEEDYDGDRLSNTDEFLEGSNPADPDDPKVTRFVALGGNELPFPGGGTEENPWNLSFGLSQLQLGVATQDFQLLLEPGIYSDPIDLPTGGGIVGPPSCDPNVPGDCVILQGAVTAAAGSVLENVTLTVNPGKAVGDPVLLTMNDIAMEVNGVRFDGMGMADVVGIQTFGSAPGDVIISGCLFTGLKIGIEVFGDIPTLRRSIFELSGNGITIHRGDGTKSVSKSLGDAANPQSGYNTFKSSVFPYAVDIRGTGVFTMQNNDWDIDPDLTVEQAEAEISDRIDGSAVVVPYAGRGAAILASALFCVVSDSSTQTKISNASVKLTKGQTTIEVIENFEGVYAFPALGHGNYKLDISVPGTGETFAARSNDIELKPGELKTINILLGPPPPPLPKISKSGMSCHRGSSAEHTHPGGGDIALVLILMVGLICSGRFRRAQG